MGKLAEKSLDIARHQNSESFILCHKASSNNSSRSPGSETKGTTIFESRQDATDGAAALCTDWDLYQHRCDNPKISLTNQYLSIG